MKTSTVLSIVSALFVASCASTVAPGSVGRVLLEVEYVNFAWKPTYHGFYIESGGDVYRYDRNGIPWEQPDSTTLYPDDLSEKYLPIRTVIDTRSKAELAGISDLIDGAAGGPYSPVKHQCADAGTLTYRAYKKDTNPERYTPILLRVEGDVARQNTSAAAQQLIAYIRSLKLIDEISGCDP